MEWRKGRRSSNIEDRRGSRSSGGGGRMGGRGVKMGGGIGGMGIILLLIVFLTGGNPLSLLGDMLGGGGGQQTQPQYDPRAQQNPMGSATGGQIGTTDEQADFVSVVLADTEDTWTSIFAQAGVRYQAPKLVMFTGSVNSACGMNTAASGPFYCPGDSKVYIDLSFFSQLERMGARGDFARAYVIGHEIAHHVQNLEGTSMEVQKMQRRVSKTESNQLSVLVELQADCYAGVWAHHAEKQRDLLESGDVEEGMQAAASIGDDAIQRGAGARVRPESFTHGSSAQRVEWFRRGIATGDVRQCDTFGAARRG